MLLLTTSVSAVSKEPLNAESFKRCLATLQQTAAEQGINEQIVSQTLPNLKLVNRVIELDRRQPEFTQTFAGYRFDTQTLALIHLLFTPNAIQTFAFPFSSVKSTFCSLDICYSPFKDKPYQNCKLLTSKWSQIR